MKHIVIIGGGITGLAAAFHLQEQIKGTPDQVSCTLVEARNRLGGKILTEKENGFIIEGGPDSFITQKPWGLELCRKLGLQDHLIETNPVHRKVYVFSGGKLHPLPEGLSLMAPTRLIPFLTSRLLTPLGKLRTAMDLVLPARRDHGDESLASFVRRRLGTETLSKIVSPLMAGIYAGDAEHLSLESTFPLFKELEEKHRSVILGLLRRDRKQARSGKGKQTTHPALFVTLRQGMEGMVRSLIDRLAKISICQGSPVRSIHSLPQAEQAYRVELDNGQTLTANCLILTTPAYVTADLTESLNPGLAQELRKIPYASSATVSLAFERSAYRHPLQGFGFIVPRSEGLNILACTWTSTKFPHRVPSEHILIRCFLGGAGRESLMELGDEELIARAREDLKVTMGIHRQPVLTRLFRWKKANPLYDVGHQKRLSVLAEMLSGQPGLFLAGSPYHGIGIPDCIHDGFQAAGQALTHLDNPLQSGLRHSS